MKINNINYSQNFGLKETLKYKNVEDFLVHNIAEQNMNTFLAKQFIAKIKKQVPNGLLGTNGDYSRFILIKDMKDKNLRAYDLGTIDYNNPLQALINLHKKLATFLKNPFSKSIYSDDVSIRFIDGLNVNNNKITKEIVIDKV